MIKRSFFSFRSHTRTNQKYQINEKLFSRAGKRKKKKSRISEGITNMFEYELNFISVFDFNSSWDIKSLREMNATKSTREMPEREKKIRKIYKLGVSCWILRNL